MKALNLYSVRVGNTGYFFVAAENMDEAIKMGKQWAKERKLHNPQVAGWLVKKVVYVNV